MLWRTHRSFQHTVRVGTLFVLSLVFAALTLNCLFFTDWSPDASVFDWLRGTYIARESSGAPSPSDLTVDHLDGTWLDQRVAARRKLYFGRFATAQLLIGGLYICISLGAARGFWRLATTYISELTAIFDEHRITHWRVTYHGFLAFPLVTEVPFRDLLGKSAVFSRPLSEFRKTAYGGGAILLTLRDRKAPVAIMTPDRLAKLLPGEVWQVSKMYTIFSQHRAAPEVVELANRRK